MKILSTPLKKFLAIPIFLLSLTSHAANSQKYCDAISSLAMDYVSDRDARQPYKSTIQTIDISIYMAKLSGKEAEKWRRDLYASAKIAYIDFPKISREGIYKLVILECMSE